MTASIAIHTAYVICAVQRSGSFLLCKALKNTGLAGMPEEYFLYKEDEPNWENGWWARHSGAPSRSAYLELVLAKGTTANGVFGRLFLNSVGLCRCKLFMRSWLRLMKRRRCGFWITWMLLIRLIYCLGSEK